MWDFPTYISPPFITNFTVALGPNPNSNKDFKSEIKNRKWLCDGFMERRVELEFHLGFGDDFDSDVLAFEITLKQLCSTSITKVSSSNLVPNLKLVLELFRESEVLVQSNHFIFRDGGLVGLHRAVAPGQHGPDVLRRRRRPEEPSGIRRRRRLAGEKVVGRARSVEREKW